MTSQKRTVQWLVLLTAIIASVLIYFLVVKPKMASQTLSSLKIDGVILPQAQDVQDFKLSATNGGSFTKNNLVGHWTMLFFGFTNCGYVCPTTLTALNKMMVVLEKELPTDQLPQIVMMSVDPERDSLKKMKQYMSAFNPRFIGIRAELPDTVAFEKQLHIVAVKVQAEGKKKNDYYYDHSAEILLFNPEGKLQAYFSFPHTPEQMVKDYKAILKLSS